MKSIDGFVPKYYRMNPEIETLVQMTTDLMNGMKVLIADPNRRASDEEMARYSWGYDRGLEMNRWCVVSNFEHNKADNTYTFTAAYEDGERRRRLAPHNQAWLVKKDSIAESKAKFAQVHELVLMVMRAQDAATYHGDSSGDVMLLAEQVSHKIVGIFE